LLEIAPFMQQIFHNRRRRPIARAGSSKSVTKAINGALREQGKLVLCFSMKELCMLLRGFDVGSLQSPHSKTGRDADQHRTLMDRFSLGHPA
jgi:hypothetical protein